MWENLDKEVKRGVDAVLTAVALFAGWVFVAKYDAALYQEKSNIIALYTAIIGLVSFGIISFFLRLFTASAAIVLSLVFCGVYDANTSKVLIEKGPITIAEWVAFISAVITLCLFAVRMKHQSEQVDAQNRQIKNQTEQNADQMFNAAVTLLGSSETSARTGAIYSLYYLALDNAKYRKQIAQILCSHIRSKTREKEYQKEHGTKPSNEVQTTIDLLFRDFSEQKGLYCIFDAELSRAHLSRAYLTGVNFRDAHCEKANFSNAHCQRANFSNAHCQRADFSGSDSHFEETDFKWAHCEGAIFKKAHFEGAVFVEAHCEGAVFSDFTNSHFEGAIFADAHCEGADFSGAYCQGGVFTDAHCEGAIFAHARCEGANFSDAHCEGADFSGAHCEGADFSGAYCQGGVFTGAHCEGAFADSEIKGEDLEARFGKDTEINNMIVFGEFARDAIDNIERAQRDARKFLPENWHTDMQAIINLNQGDQILGAPDGIIKNYLIINDEEFGDNKLQVLARRLEEIKRRRYNA